MVFNEALADTEYGKQLMTVTLPPPNSVYVTTPSPQSVGVLNQLMWPVAVDTEAAYESALLAGRGAPGFDPDIITDAALTASINAHWPYADGETPPAADATSKKK